MDPSKSYVIASERPWNNDLAERLRRETGSKFEFLKERADLTAERLAVLQPRYVFIVHWSERIPEEVWSSRECIVFHMTDVPYGRGGSPLQNLIVRKHEATMISALRCTREFDAGPVYLKKPLSLHGTAEEVFLRADRIIEKMILEIARVEPVPVAQLGEAVVFKRRRPEDGDLRKAQNTQDWHDMIRMLDAEGYPRAYVDVGEFRIEFSRVTERVDGLVADAMIRKRSKEDQS